MKALCIIPARGGSKGIPSKNLQPVGGGTLLRRAAIAAKGSCCELVVVSTDDEAIAAEACRAGAFVVGRDPATASDEASSESCLLDALKRIGAGDWYPLTPSPRYPVVPWRFDVLVMVQCTSPFVEPQDIDACVELVDQNWECAFAASRFHGFLWQVEAKNAWPTNHQLAVRPRRQDLRPQFLEAGSVYAMRLAGFLKNRHRFFGRVALHEIPIERAFEIDTTEDLRRARALCDL